MHIAFVQSVTLSYIESQSGGLSDSITRSTLVQVELGDMENNLITISHTVPCQLVLIRVMI